MSDAQNGNGSTTTTTTAPVTQANVAQPVQQALPLAQPQQAQTIGNDALRELETLRNEMKARDALLAKHKDELTAAANERSKAIEQRNAERIEHALLDAARAHDAIKPEHVVALTRGAVKLLDDGRVVSAADEKIAVADAVKAFLAENPHLSRSRVSSGSGALPSGATISDTGAGLDLSTPEGRNAYVRSLVARPPPQRVARN